MKENSNLKLYPISEIKNLKIHGRTTGCLSPLTLFWTGSAVELNVKGSELWVEVEVDYDTYEPWISILVNSVPVSRQMLTVGRYWICILRGMNGNEIKNVRIVKEVQAMSGDPNCSLKFHAVKFDGEFLPVEKKLVKIEFIGDSITSGEGVIGAKKEEDWIPMCFSAVSNYTAMTAEALNADYRVLSQSGWGVMTSWDNNPSCNLPANYEKVCGVLSGDKNKELGAFQENDFTSWQPDVVVVNLGTNDEGAFYNQGWVDETTGTTHKQRLNDDGSFQEEDLKAFEEAVTNFLIKLRSYNKNAHLIWAYGMLGLPMMPAISHAVETYRKSTGDAKVSVVELPGTTQETIGARRHPGVLSHEKAAGALVKHMKQIL